MEEAAKETPVNAKSDVEAKAAFCSWLRENGYVEVRVSASPVDVVAKKDGEPWFFEVKFTQARTHCFGAATLTEWAAAAEDPEHFRFVIAYRREGQWRFDRYTPEQFMAFSSVPPFKVYFNVPLDDRPARKPSELSKRIHLTRARLKLLAQQFAELRTLNE